MDFSAIFLGQKVYFLLFWCMIAGSLAKLVVKEKEAADLQLDQVDTIWIVMLNPPRETEFPSAFYKINIFDDQQVRTHKGNDRVQDVTSINIGIGGDGKDILLGGDGNQENVFAIANLFPTYFNGMCLWFLKVILAVLNLRRKKIQITFKTMFISWLEHIMTKYKRLLDNR